MLQKFQMEAGFTLHSKRQLNLFYGYATEQRLEGLFMFMDEWLMQSVRLIMGESFGSLIHRYKKNIDIYSLIMAWDLDLGEQVETIREVMRTIVPKDFLDGLDSMFKWVIPDVGMGLREGNEDEKRDSGGGVVPFI